MLDVQTLVEAGDIGGLLRAVDALAASREWGRLADLGARCRTAAQETGRQLWSVTMHVEYRLALEGPAPYAAAVLVPGAGRFALGPLTEVAASRHAWASLAPHLTDPVSASAVAQERVLRGEDLTAGPEPACGLLPPELPLLLCDWEPAYALPGYRDRDAEFPGTSALTRTLGHAVSRPVGTPGPTDEGVVALRALVEPWVRQSEGEVTALVVEGRIADAVGALSSHAAIGELASSEGLAAAQWAGASGGAHGRRPGGARGRFAAWSAAAALVGLDWPPDPAELGEAIAELRWCRWEPPSPAPGWACRMAIEDPIDGLAWGLDALDRAPETPSAALATGGDSPL